MRVRCQKAHLTSESGYFVLAVNFEVCERALSIKTVTPPILNLSFSIVSNSHINFEKITPLKLQKKIYSVILPDEFIRSKKSYL